MDEILKYEPEFTEAKFKTYADNIFIQLHLALVTKELENISSLCEEDTIKNLIDKDKLSDSEYYYDFYLDLMYTEKDLEMLNSTKEEMEILSTKLNEFLDKVDEILTFLETNANYIEYTDTDIYISDDNILNEYNNLIEELTTLANNMDNRESDI